MASITPTTSLQHHVKVLGWPEGETLPCSKSNYFAKSTSVQLALRYCHIFIGAQMDTANDTLLVQTLDDLDPTTAGLCIITDINAWTRELCEIVQQHLPNSVSQFQVCVFDKTLRTEVVKTQDRRSSPPRICSSISIPLDYIDDEAASRITKLPCLCVLRILPPLLEDPSNFLDNYEEITDQIKFILLHATHLRKVALPVDLDTSKLEEYFETLNLEFPYLKSVEFLEPTSYDLLALRQEWFGEVITTRIENAIIKAMEFSLEIRHITLPLALATPRVLETLKRLPNLTNTAHIAEGAILQRDSYSLHGGEDCEMRFTRSFSKSGRFWTCE